VACVFIALAALPFGALAWADHDAAGRVPDGTVIGGVNVGGLTASTAIKRLRAQIGIPARRAISVSIDSEHAGTLTARRAHVRLDIAALVHRAVERGRRGSFLTRGWRELTGKKLAFTSPVRIRADRRAVQRFVDGLEATVAKPTQDATLSIDVHSVSVTEGQDGQRLADPDGLVDALMAALRDRTAERHVEAETETVPAQSGTALLDAPVVTVSHAERTVRVFEHGQVVTSYPVAVGQPAYPTPNGTFAVQTMQKDPAWNVPNSEWAGDLAGKTIPGGDPANPLIARFIGFDGSVGFHGTADIASLGTAASHGCVRMRPDDVKDLYDRVSVGTTVYVG
jgi:lipoprotein-anchoring transpeptidase ErfK/SrfK